jgi:hypothetical protein
MHTICPGCGLRLPAIDAPLDPKVKASAECRNLSHQLTIYTLERRDSFFIHQVVVDAYAAQHYKSETPTIGLAFALFGLCLLLEHDATGKEVQEAHQRLAQEKRTWPSFAVPVTRGTMTVADVLHAVPGEERDQTIIRWADGVWASYRDEQEHVREVLRSLGQF